MLFVTASPSPAPGMATPKEKRMDKVLSHLIVLSEQVRSAVDEAKSFKSECSELGKQVDRLSPMLHSLARFTTSARSLYERPIRPIAAEVSRNLEQGLALAHKCKHHNILHRVVTKISAADFGKIADLLDASLGDLTWLLSVYGEGKDGGNEFSLPPIASNDPILGWVWSYIAWIHMRPLPVQIEAANELASLACDNDRNKTIIVEEGGVPPLLKLLKGWSATDAQMAAATALCCLANDQRRVQAIVDELGVETIVPILEDAPRRVQIEVASLVASMAAHCPIAREYFGRKNAIRPLVTLLSFDMFVDNSKAGKPKQNIHSIVQINKEKGSKSLGKLNNHNSYSDGSRSGSHKKDWENEKPEVKMKLKTICTKALWMLARGNLVNSKKITETKGLLCLAKLLDERGELQHYCLMTIMEITAAAEADVNLRRAAFKTNSPAAKLVVDQLLKVMKEIDSPSLQVPAIKSIGSLARTFPAKETRVLVPLVSQLNHSDQDVATEAAISLGKFLSPDNYLHKEHARAIIESRDVPPAVRLQILPLLSEVWTTIDDWQSQLPPDQIIKANDDLSEGTRNLPGGGVLEISDRVYVFDYCLTRDWSFSGQITTDWLKDDGYKFYMRGIVAKLQDQFSAASFMVLNLGEQDNQSQMTEVLSEYDITVMELPQNYGGCPILRLENIHNFLRSADEWKKQDGEQKTLDMIYKKAPYELLQLTSTLNPLPSQLRYLHYVSTQNAGLDWPPQDKALVINSVVLRSIPIMDAEGGCRPIVKILGQDPFMVADQTAKVLFSTPRRSGHVRHYKQADGETDKLDIHCNVQGDVVLECMSLDANLEHGELMFRAMFNTVFVSDNVLKLEFDGMDVPWDRKDQYPKEFMAEIVFSQVDVATSLVMVDLSSEKKENLKEKSMRKIEPKELSAEGQEVTYVGDSASSLAINNGTVEATAADVFNSVQIPDLTLPKQEKVYQLGGSPSSTSMSSGYDYDVFLSFRGPDTRSGITNFLYTKLLGARIHTFKDDEELRVGEEFGPELLKAISQSKIAIPIFSKGYASSKWCLNELVQMVGCSKTRRQKIMPIFYDVTPAEVRHQIGSYEEAFLSHKEKFGANISKWKAALNHVANLNGWDNSKKNRGEGELVDEIVKKVIDELKTAYLLVTDCLVGVENHVKEIDTMMCGDLEDIRILGIHGMGGVGKTTLAKIIYNRLLHNFEACCFLSNIKGTSELKGMESLQNQLISDVLKKKWSKINNVEEGIKVIKERLCGKKVLLLLDDVDQMTHWDALIGKPTWFGLGSRIIITSRNRDIVNVP
ncbi:hypothetical protein BT93_I1227 [Corymbia citriodora subsp. variegata]|nr:hypothetical protein BT93_I1227 [Corymbia citriodora subsp. variegata]